MFHSATMSTIFGDVDVISHYKINKKPGIGVWISEISSTVKRKNHPLTL